MAIDFKRRTPQAATTAQATTDERKGEEKLSALRTANGDVLRKIARMQRKIREVEAEVENLRKWLADSQKSERTRLQSTWTPICFGLLGFPERSAKE